ncbi:NB-ARC domain-containing protein [Fusarium keratoplasticum]|nr:NB-ARC domain-containing protein [Fusarium keratoplasticum]
MSAHSGHEQRDISHSHFRDRNFINQGNVQGNIYYGLPHPPARAEVVRVIPYPRNEDLVHRGDLIDRLDKLLPPTLGSHSAALWGLGGSGKTQIALDYAYRRCDADDECGVFWVHADNEATFLADYKTIGKKLGVDERLDGPDLLDAVRDGIEAQRKWLMVFDNADDLKLFGVRQEKGDGTKENQSLRKYVPCTSQGTVLWTSRDAHITGTLVGPRQGVEVRSMAMDEATTLLARVRDEPLTAEEASGEVGANALLEELQCLPLAISQAGAYMRRISMTAEQYLALLRQGQTRWEVLKISDADRHRRPEVSNSVLETWRISTERIRVESEMSYRILHVIAYVDSQDIPQELIAAATGQYDTDDKSLPMQVTELEVLEAVTRWKEFSFLSLRQSEDGERSYEMHKLVQEAVRYGLGVRGPMQTTVGKAPRAESGPSEPENGEAYYSGIALQVVDGLFPSSEPTSWAQCEQYVTHAIRVAEWAEVSGTEIDTVTLLARVSYFLYERGRWREKEPVDSRAWGLRRKVLGEKHPDTISSMASLATTYHGQGRYDEAKRFKDEALALRREVLGEKHPDTIRSMAGLAATYHAQGQYDEAEEIVVKVLDLRREVLGEKHPDTIRSMAGLATTYHQQGRYDEAERLEDKVLELRREVLGEKHPDTISSMADLATTYHQQGRYDEAEEIAIKVLDLRREVLGEKHPDTIRSMAGLATTYHQQGRYDEAEEIVIKVLDLRREVLGEKHPDTIRSMAGLATTYHQQGRADMTRLRD